MHFINWETFHFLRPLWLLSALALVPLLWLALRQQSVAGAWERVCDSELLQHLLVGQDGRARRWPLFLFAFGWLSAGAALAGPTWERLPQPTFEDPLSTVIVLSLAPSMDRRDLKPSRLARARFKIHDALAFREGGQIGLVVFAEDPYPVMPLTDDPDVVASTIPLLTTDLMPGRGVHLGAAIEEAHGLLRRAGVPDGRILVLADTPSDEITAALEAARAAAGDDYPVSVIGVGQDEESLAALERVAAAGDGLYAALSVDDSDLERVLPEREAFGLSPLEGEESQARFDVWRDMGVWLLLIPLALGSFAFRKGWTGAPAFLFLGLFGGQDQAPFQAAKWFQRPDQRAAVAFQEGRHGEAAQLFRDPRWRAASLYRAGDYGAAAEILAGLEDAESRYNLGNALARQGELEEAIAAYTRALKLDPEHADARFNRDLLQKLLDEKNKEQEQQDSQQDCENPEPAEGGEPGQEDQQNQQGQQGQESPSGQGSPSPGAAPDSDSQEEGSAQDGASGASPGADYEEVAGSGQDESQPEADGSDELGRETNRPLPESQPKGRVSGATGSETTEEEQAIEQWLGRIPDDPAGLLRAKIRRRYLERHANRL